MYNNDSDKVEIINKVMNLKIGGFLRRTSKNKNGMIYFILILSTCKGICLTYITLWYNLLTIIEQV